MLINRAGLEDLEGVAPLLTPTASSSVSLKRLWILNDLFVRPDVRRGGVGRRLLSPAAGGVTRSSSITPCSFDAGPHRFDISATEP
jgi:GNAT superfamily N-acetyltransferase